MIATLLTLILTAIMSPQTTITGNVTDDKGEPLYGALISIKGKNGNIHSYTMSNKSGDFVINIDAIPEEWYLEISMLGYANERIDPPIQEKIEISLKESTLDIREVVIKAEKVSLQGDTTTFFAQGLITASDKNLSDVLKRLPGLDVSDDGFVQYQGKNIASLRIEGNDLLGSKYNLATQNLNPEDLKTIEIYENHQNIKALEGIAHSKDIVLNITLKDDAKNTWIATVQAEGGASSQKPYIPYGAGGFIMNIGKQFQTMTTLKTDAAGNDIIIKPSISPFPYTLRNFFTIDAPNAPLNEKRSRFNTSYSASNNTTIPLNNTSSISVSGSYNNNTLDSKSYVGKFYNYDNDSTVSFIENRNVRMYEQDAMGDIAFESNSKTFYINERFSFQWKSISARDSLSGSQNQLEQATNRSFDIGNEINTIIPLKNKSSFNISLNTQYSTKKAQYYLNESDVRQDINSSVFLNTLIASYQHSFNTHWSLNIIPQIYYINRALVSDLISPLNETDIKLNNNLRMQEITPKALLILNYKGKRIEFNFTPQLNYNNFFYTGDSYANYNILSTNTYMSLGVNITKKLKFNIAGIYALQPTSEQSLYDGVIMNNYKYLSKGRDTITNTPTYNLIGSLIYKEPLSGWNISAGGNYLLGQTHLTSRYFIEDFIITEYSDEIADYSNWNINGKVEKSFYDINSKISLSINYTEQYSTLNQNGVRYNYRNNLLTPKIEFNGNIARWMNVIYNGTYTYSKYHVDNSIADVPNHTLSQEIKLTFYPHKKVEVSLSAEHYYNMNSSRIKQQMALLDCSAWYFVTNKLQIFLHAKNLLNEKTYRFTEIAPLQTTHYNYNIRPINILIGIEYRF